MSGPVRILRVVARMNTGGPARQIIELSKGLRSRGFETLVATGEAAPWEGDLCKTAADQGVAIVKIPGLGAAVRPFHDLRALRALMAIMRKWRPDVVHTHTAKAGVLGRIASILSGRSRRVHTFHGTVLDHYFSRSRSKMIGTVERRLAARTHRIVAVSHAVADELEGIGMDGSKIRVIEPVIDLEPFLQIKKAHGPLRELLQIPPDAVLAGFAGRFVPVKDPLTFVHAAGLLSVDHPRLFFVMIGAGPLEGEVRATIERLKLQNRVSVCGFVDSLAPVYRELDLLINTSLKEGMPVTVLEAAAAGLPVVATDVGGTPELIAADRSGMLAPPGDARAIARAVTRLLELPREDSATMRGVARVRARERYGLVRGLDRHATLYREVLEL